MNELSEWHESLRSVALVGTDRRAAGPPPAGFPRAPDGVDPQHALLGQAAMLDGAQRGGMLPIEGVAPLAEAPAETRAEAPERAVRLLELLLTQPPVPARYRADALRLWLSWCDAVTARVPHRLIAPLLAGSSPETRAQVDRVTGSRGRWLREIAQGVEDPWPAGSEDEFEQAARTWAHETATDAAQTLRALRRLDPRRAAAFLGERWQDLPARDRAVHAAALEEGLSDRDEPILELLLDDQAAAVRTAAQSLLRRLPASRYAQRMVQRLLPLLRVARGRIEVHPPESVDAAGIRDGLSAPPKQGEPRRLAWLEQIIEAVPVAAWPYATGMTPDAIAAGLAADPRVLALLGRRAIADRDEVWAAALFRHSADVALLPAMAEVQRDAVLLAALPGRKSDLGTFPALLAAAPKPWSRSLTEALVRRALAAPDDRAYASRVLRALPEGAAPASAPFLEAVVADPGNRGNASFDHLALAVTVHSFSRSIWEAFS